MNISNSEEGIMRFIDGIYKPCIEKCKNIQNVQNVLSALANGTAVLDSEAKCDQYVAFYGGHHFHKLYAAFASTNFHYTDGKKLEIIDWGCGQALATCVLIDYFIESKLKPEVVSITLVEPSLTALERGYNLACQMLQSEAYATPTIRRISKYIDDLQPSDLISDMDSIKVHLFSNIIDVEAFSLDELHELIIGSFRGLNRFICTSPDNDRRYRLSNFYDLFSQSGRIYNSVVSEEPIYKKVFYFKTGRYEERRIGVCERQFTVNLIQS